MNEFDNYFGKDAESVYSQGYKESEKYKEFLQYLCDKGVALSIVKCRLSSTQSCSRSGETMSSPIARSRR
jgi:hypothetical protein